VEQQFLQGIKKTMFKKKEYSHSHYILSFCFFNFYQQ
jgi:hypothetical protein